ncbi:MAG: hypothetical protein AAF236_01490 [Verrucomicrobiota bacterium]
MPDSPTNKRRSRLSPPLVAAFARLWRERWILALALIYWITIGWLFLGERPVDLRPERLLAVDDSAQWLPPGSVHWLGTTPGGEDLLMVSRLAIASSMARAVLVAFGGVGLAVVIALIGSLDLWQGRWRFFKEIGESFDCLPAMWVFVVIGAGLSGRWDWFLGLAMLIIGWQASRSMRLWTDQLRQSRHHLVGHGLGLSTRQLLIRRIIPVLLRRSVGLIALLIPVVVMLEMSLGFLGLTGDWLNIGTLVAEAQPYLLEAPWLIIGPGLIAGGFITIFSILGFAVARATGAREIPIFL